VEVELEIIESIAEAQAYAQGKQIGLVPTLGGLHKGHQSLIQQANKENDVTVLSIFLNPMQFRQPQFLAYPSDFEQDKIVASETNVDMIFHPSVDEIFPNTTGLDDFTKYQANEFKQRDSFVVEPQNNGIDNVVRVPANLVYRLDGKLHPWVFDGAATIVYKLFQIFSPHRAYFGEKDIQQLAILKSMAKLYFPQIEVVGVPTLRDNDGLPFSSRNTLLSKQQRDAALKVHHALRHGEQLIKAGESDYNLVLDSIKARIAEEKLVKIDHLEIIEDQDIILYIAFFVNDIRLIDTSLSRSQKKC
jgi:pantoate--beta-alanine ligase